eukprot:255634-Prorocentrum_lima.AAC.1
MLEAVQAANRSSIGGESLLSAKESARGQASGSAHACRRATGQQHGSGDSRQSPSPKKELWK